MLENSRFQIFLAVTFQYLRKFRTRENFCAIPLLSVKSTFLKKTLNQTFKILQIKNNETPNKIF